MIWELREISYLKPVIIILEEEKLIMTKRKSITKGKKPNTTV